VILHNLQLSPRHSRDILGKQQETFVQNLSAGKYIKHFQYGCGVVTASDASRTTIDFDTHGKKLFVTNLMVVEEAEGVPPKRRRAKAVKAKKAEATVATRVFVAGAK
jgi:hypothetical protein